MSAGWKYLIAVAAAAFLAYQLFDYGRAVSRQACELTQQTQRADQAEATVDRAIDNSARDDRRDNLRQEADDDHTDRIQELETDRNALRAELDRLRHTTSAAVRRAQQAASAEGEAAEQGRQAAAALGELFQACAARYSVLAAEADRAVATGLKCEAEHAADETLNDPVPDTPASGAGLSFGADPVSR